LENQREEERARNLVARAVPNPALNRAPLNGGAWWTNDALTTRLKLSDAQKARIERAFENHWRNIVLASGALEKEEAQLARLLEAEPLDRNAALAQTSRAIQARAEVERATAAMTLEMREQLTAAQWAELQTAVSLPSPAAQLRQAADDLRRRINAGTAPGQPAVVPGQRGARSPQ